MLVVDWAICFIVVAVVGVTGRAAYDVIDKVEVNFVFDFIVEGLELFYKFIG